MSKTFISLIGGLLFLLGTPAYAGKAKNLGGGYYSFIGGGVFSLLDTDHDDFEFDDGYGGIVELGGRYRFNEFTQSRLGLFTDVTVNEYDFNQREITGEYIRVAGGLVIAQDFNFWFIRISPQVGYSYGRIFDEEDKIAGREVNDFESEFHALVFGGSVGLVIPCNGYDISIAADYKYFYGGDFNDYSNIPDVDLRYQAINIGIGFGF